MQRNWVFATNSDFLNHIFAIQCPRPWILQTMNSGGLNNLSLKLQRFTSSDCNNIEIRKCEFVAKIQFLCKFYFADYWNRTQALSRNVSNGIYLYHNDEIETILGKLDVILKSVNMANYKSFYKERGYSYRKPYIKENRQCKFRTVVSKSLILCRLSCIFLIYHVSKTKVSFPQYCSGITQKFEQR